MHMQEKKFKCVGCGRQTELGIPYCICKKCSKVLDNFFKAKTRHRNLIRKRWGIIPLKFEGKGDTIYSVNMMGEQISEIEEQLQWIKNGLANIANHSEDKKVTKKRKDGSPLQNESSGVSESR